MKFLDNKNRVVNCLKPPEKISKLRTLIASMAVCAVLVDGCETIRHSPATEATSDLAADAYHEVRDVMRSLAQLKERRRQNAMVIELPQIQIGKSRYEGATMTLSYIAPSMKLAPNYAGYYALQVTFLPQPGEPQNVQYAPDNAQSVHVEEYVSEKYTQATYQYSSQFNLLKIDGKREWSVSVQEESIAGMTEYGNLFETENDFTKNRNGSRSQYDRVVTNPNLAAIVHNNESILDGVNGNKPVSLNLETINLPIVTNSGPSVAI